MLHLSENARTVLRRRDYLKRNGQGMIVETPDHMFQRVANAVAAASGSYGEDVAGDAQEFYRMMISLEFLPNSPTLMHAGRNGVNQLSACFVLPIDDSLESIFKTLHDAALVLRTGGGVGFAFSRLRPRGSAVTTTGGVASGPVSYMDLFDHMAQVINEGSSRRVAMMGILRVDHPDIEEFIMAKGKEGRLTNFNVSVGITDRFMSALRKRKSYALVDPHTNAVVRRVPAEKVFELLCEYAWKVADPGLVFIDRMNRACPIRHLGEIEATNPCGEQPLLPFQSCNLGAINLSKFVRRSHRKSASGSLSIDWQRLRHAARMAVRFLDNVVDVCDYPLPEIHAMSRETRKIGLGVMGFADLLFQLGVPYDSQRGLVLGRKLARFIATVGREESVALGKARGSFPAFTGSRWEKEYPAMRNSTITTIAPTGTISILASCSSGIEPVFALSFTRRNILDIGETKLAEFNGLFRRRLANSVRGRRRREILERVAQTGSCQQVEGLSAKIKRVFVTSHDVSWSWHVHMQAAWQEHIDSAVSKTVNLSHSASVADVQNAYLAAYDSGCMGITIYRDRSRTQQVLNLGSRDVGNRPLNGEGDRTPHHNYVALDGEERICPDCQTPMVFQDGCANCPHCAYSYCQTS